MAQGSRGLRTLGKWAVVGIVGCSPNHSTPHNEDSAASSSTADATSTAATPAEASTNTSQAPSTTPGSDESAATSTSIPTDSAASNTTGTATQASGSANVDESDASNTSTSTVANDSSQAVETTQPDVAPEPFEFVPVDELPRIEEMPDPLTMRDGTKVTTLAQWRTRRQEMIAILEAYEYGHMPPPPNNVTASSGQSNTEITTRDDVRANYRALHLTFGPDESLGFDLGLFTPVTSESATDGRFPVLLYLTQSTNQSSIGAATAALSRGYAVATVAYQQLGADAPNYADTGFFPAYPEYDWRDFSAWAWGLSRAVDYLVTDPEIDAEKILTTGVSRLAQAVLLAGAFDERIALTAPVAGGMAFRFSGKEMGNGLGQGITEIVDQNTYWFGPHFEEFRNRTERLPCDQHWLLALAAPRLFILSNSLSDEYGRAYAAVQTYLGAKPVYEFLEAEDNLGIHFRPGGHGMTAENWSAILDFSDQYLLGKSGARRFDELPPDDQLP